MYEMQQQNQMLTQQEIDEMSFPNESADKLDDLQWDYTSITQIELLEFFMFSTVWHIKFGMFVLLELLYLSIYCFKVSLLTAIN